MYGRAGDAPAFSSRALSLHRVSLHLHYGSMGDCPADSSPIVLIPFPQHTIPGRSCMAVSLSLLRTTGLLPRLTNPYAAMTLTPPMPTPDPSASAGMHCSAPLRRHVSALRPAESLTMATDTSPRMSLTSSIASASALLPSLLRQCRAGPDIRALPRPVRSYVSKATSMWGVPPALDARTLTASRRSNVAAPLRSTRIPANTEPNNAPQGGRAVAMRKPLPLTSGMARTMAALPCASRCRSRTSPHECGALPHGIFRESKKGLASLSVAREGDVYTDKGNNIPFTPF